MNKLAFIGFGEAATAFLSGWTKSALMQISAYDIKTDAPDEAVRLAKLEDYKAAGIKGCDTLSEALEGANIIFSLVTADQALVAAKAAAVFVKEGAFYFDCNSCAPHTKQQAGASIGQKGANYIDVAVMAPVGKAKHKTPLLMSGANSAAAEKILQQLDMQVQFLSDKIGAASSVKMMRSIMIKGMEAITVECMLAARKAGVEEYVLDSLQSSDPDINWRERTSYILERVMVHGQRRAAEMREVSSTLQHIGLDGKITTATAEWQQMVGELGLEADSTDYHNMLDNILQKLIKD